MLCDWCLTSIIRINKSHAENCRFTVYTFEPALHATSMTGLTIQINTFLIILMYTVATDTG